MSPKSQFKIIVRLEAKEGEAIIVIAQSTPEWFVAKPITFIRRPMCCWASENSLAFAALS